MIIIMPLSSYYHFLHCLNIHISTLLNESTSRKCTLIEKGADVNMKDNARKDNNNNIMVLLLLVSMLLLMMMMMMMMMIARTDHDGFWSLLTNHTKLSFTQ